MTILIPEILGIICSFLSIKDVRRFRLCCKDFADVGACFVHRNVIFYLHHGDFDMLRHISLHPVASKYVRMLVYMNHTLGTSKISLDQFRSSYAALHHIKMVMARRRNIPIPPLIGSEQLERIYRNYEATLEQQDKILQSKADFSHIREAVSRFPGLEEVVVSSDDYFWEDKNDPFDFCMGLGGGVLEPAGVRHLDSILAAIFDANIRLKKLAAGIISWEFFQKPRVELSRALSLLTDLTCLRLMIDTTDKTTKCRQLIESGLLRGFIQSLTKLHTLDIIFSWDPNHGPQYLPRLEDFIEPKNRWDDLENLTLGQFTCERQELWSMLKKHKDTLRVLGLEDVYLRTTSWQELLPKMRRTLELEDAFMRGQLYGKIEPWDLEEHWDLEDDDELRDDLNDYLVGDENIKRCPLNRRNQAEFAPW